MDDAVWLMMCSPVAIERQRHHPHFGMTGQRITTVLPLPNSMLITPAGEDIFRQLCQLQRGQRGNF